MFSSRYVNAAFLFVGHGGNSDFADICDAPESPRVLVRNGKVAEASEVIDMLSLEEDPTARAMATVRR